MSLHSSKSGSHVNLNPEDGMPASLAVLGSRKAVRTFKLKSRRKRTIDSNCTFLPSSPLTTLLSPSRFHYFSSHEQPINLLNLTQMY